MSELMKVSSTPHVRAKDSTSRIMLTVVIALLPAAGFGVWHFGWKALLLILVTVATCVLSEWLFCLAVKKKSTIGDFSAVVTGMLLAMNLPSIEEKLRRVRERMQIHPGEYLESAKNEALEIRDRFLNIRYHALELKTVRDHWKRGMILGNPTMKGSRKVRYSLDELKEAVKGKLKYSNNK